MKTEPFGRFPEAANGSTTTYEADYVWADNGSGYYAFVGGSWNDGLNCGPFYANLYNTPSNSNTNIGAALSYLLIFIMQCISPRKRGKGRGNYPPPSSPLGEN